MFNEASYPFLGSISPIDLSMFHICSFLDDGCTPATSPVTSKLSVPLSDSTTLVLPFVIPTSQPNDENLCRLCTSFDNTLSSQHPNTQEENLV